MPAPTVDGHVAGSQSGGSSQSVILFTTLTDDIIVVCVFSENVNTTSPTVSSVSGGSLTWATRKAVFNSSNNRARMEIWWALSSAAQISGMSVTVQLSGNTDNWTIIAFGVNGCYTPSPWDSNISLPAVNASLGSGGASVTAATSMANDLMIAVVGGVPLFGSYDDAGTPTNYGNVDFSHSTGGSLTSEEVAASDGVTTVQSGTVTWTVRGTTGTPILIVDALTADQFPAAVPVPVAAWAKQNNQIVDGRMPTMFWRRRRKRGRVFTPALGAC